MAEASTFLATQRGGNCPPLEPPVAPPLHAVVTGANKGIGLEICRQLASKGVTVVLASRDEKRGLEAVCKLKEESSVALSGEVVFHQLDVTNSASIDSLAEFVRTQFGKLDILVNNAGIVGTVIDYHALTAAVERVGGWNIPGKSIRDALEDIENLTKDRIDEIFKEFLGDLQQGQLEAKGWPQNMSAYKLSEAALNAYTRLLTKDFPSILVNSVCPGFVMTDITGNNGFLSAAEGAESPVHLALLPEDGPSGLFFSRKEVSNL
ncbi:hypothetical protein CRG98_039616 [Punica granatum]|uniref:(+)-neomenthol dehydrogenase-like n=1 Tax=Punica granatum TaxID=22663 RepID=A0A2I0I828_PUNGR|nr:hypothetical protein CRG98_039616 [Punica granatum]